MAGWYGPSPDDCGCECGCECFITGSLSLGEDDLDCEVTVNFSSQFCGNDYEEDQIKYRLTELPSSVVREGDSTDMPFSIYGREEYSYQLEVWYDLDGGESPCSGLPTEAEPHTVEVEVTTECCGDACPVDTIATQSTVTVAGFHSSLAYEVPDEVWDTGTDFCIRRPTEILKREWIDWDVLNHAIVSAELKTTDPEGCVASVVENKIVDLGLVEYREQQFIQDDGFGKPSWSYASPAGLVTLKYRVWSVFGDWQWDIAGTAPELTGNSNNHWMPVYLEVITTGSRYEEDGTLTTGYPGSMPLSNGTVPAAKRGVIVFPLGTGVGRPCNSMTGDPFWGPRIYLNFRPLYPNGLPDTYDTVGGCQADWYDYHNDPGLSQPPFADDFIPQIRWTRQ